MQTTDDPDRALKNPHDAAFRAAFRILELARAFFRDYLPENVVRHLDLESLELVNRSYVDENLKDRHADLVYKTKAGELDCLIFLLFEHQSTPDPKMAFRMLCYMLAIWRDYEANHPNFKRLPVVLPVVLYHGKARWTGPIQFQKLVDPPEAMARYVPDFEYRLVDLGVYQDKLAAFGGEIRLQAVLFLFRHIFEPDFWDRYEETAARLKDKADDTLFLEFVRWGFRYGYTSREESDEELEKIIDRTAARLGDENARREMMTIAERHVREGYVKGGMDKTREILMTQLQARFGELPSELAAKIHSARSDQLEDCLIAIFGFQSIEDVEKWWN